MGIGYSYIGNQPDSSAAALVLHENESVVNISYTIPSGKNAVSAGPITIAAGVTVTVPAGSTWTVI